MTRTILIVTVLAALSLSGCSARPLLFPPPPSPWPTEGWRFNTPEAQGFDSGKVAEALQAIRDREINIHSLMVIRNDEIILNAYFYPYDGESVHSLASVLHSGAVP